MGVTTEQVDERRLSSAEMRRVVGITYRQLDYWARTHVLVPEPREGFGSGYHFRWTIQEAMIARLVVDALSMKVSLQSVRPMAEMVRAIPEARWVVLPLVGAPVVGTTGCLADEVDKHRACIVLRVGPAALAALISDIHNQGESDEHAHQPH